MIDLKLKPLGFKWLKEAYAYRRQQKFRGWKVSRFAGFIRYAGKSFANFFIIIFVHSWFSNSTTGISTKASCSSREFSLKLSLAYSEMDESTLHWHVQISHFPACFPGWPCSCRSYSWSELVWRRPPLRLTLAKGRAAPDYFFNSERC